MAKRTIITQLQPGAALPAGEPKRYLAGHGYVRLRWKVAPYTYLETYEHRVTDGRVTTAENVHHRNRVRHDNDSGNLRPLTAAEHAAEHAGDPRTGWAPWIDEGARLYAAGLSTVAVGRAVGRDASAVWRALNRRGLIEQRRAYNRARVDEELLRERAASGAPLRELAEEFGMSISGVHGRLVELGIPRNRPGRP